MTKGRRVAVCAAAIIATLGIMPATAAHANPAGCSKSLDGFGVTGTGQLWASGSGTCYNQPYTYQTLEVEIKQNIGWQPDPVALKSSDAGAMFYYSANPLGCDHHNHADYYGRVFFGGHSDYADSAIQGIQSC